MSLIVAGVETCLPGTGMSISSQQRHSAAQRRTPLTLTNSASATPSIAFYSSTGSNFWNRPSAPVLAVLAPLERGAPPQIRCLAFTFVVSMTVF